jgi:tetratricopeptide (TPR) repeat protein
MRRDTARRKGASSAVQRHPGPEGTTLQLLSPLTPVAAAVSVLALLGSALVAYIPATRAGYVRFDDTDYIQENGLLRTMQGLQQIWTSPLAYPPGVPFYPVTFSLHWAEWHIWGTNASGYHLTSLALHAVNAVLVWLLLRRLHVPGALFGALLFAVHPVQVQSVAWLAERKNVLAALFYFLTVLAWLRCARTGSWPLYGVALVMFLLGLLSKTVICTLPVALLLWIWWRRPSPVKKYILLVLPLLGLAILLVAVVIWRENTLLEGKSFASGLSPIERLLIAGRALWFYAGKLLLPINLIPIYPHWRVDARAITPYAFPLATAAAVAVAWLLRRRLGRSPLVAVLFFTVSLAPTIGLVDFGYLAKSFVGDHYLYIPSLALFAGLASLGAKLAARLGRLGSYGAPAAAAALLLGLGVLTWRQCGVYRDAETFWSYVVAHNPSPTALSALGDVYLLKKDLIRAEPLLRNALSQRDSAPTRFRLGCVLIERQQFAAAAEQFQRALSLNRTQDRIRGLNARLLYNLGQCYWSTGDRTRAADAFRQAAELDPSMTAAKQWLAFTETAARRQPAPATSATQQP